MGFEKSWLGKVLRAGALAGAITGGAAEVKAAAPDLDTHIGREMHDAQKDMHERMLLWQMGYKQALDGPQFRFTRMVLEEHAAKFDEAVQREAERIEPAVSEFAQMHTHFCQEMNVFSILHDEGGDGMAPKVRGRHAELEKATIALKALVGLDGFVESILVDVTPEERAEAEKEHARLPAKIMSAYVIAADPQMGARLNYLLEQLHTYLSQDAEIRQIAFGEVAEYGKQRLEEIRGIMKALGIPEQPIHRMRSQT